MAQLTDSDKESLMELSRRRWLQSKEERSPVSVVPSLENNAAYCKWVTDLSRMTPVKRTVRFVGTDWKL